MMALSKAELGERFTAWERQLEGASLAEFYLTFVSSEDPSIRQAVGKKMLNLSKDNAWWQLAERLQGDPVRKVRSGSHVAVLFRPTRDAATIARFRAWRQSDNRQLRLAGLVALAQCGNGEAGLEFLESLSGVEATAERLQQVSWIVLLYPGPSSGHLKLADFSRTHAEDGYTLAYCAQVAAKIRALQPKVQWDPDRGRYPRGSCGWPWRPRATGVGRARQSQPVVSENSIA